MEMKRVDSLLWKWLFVLAAVIAALQMFGLDGWTSGLFLLTFPLTVLLWLRSVRQGMSGNDILVMLTAVLAAVSVLVDLAISGGGMSVDYVKKLVMFVTTLLLFQAASRFRADGELARFLGVVADGLTVVFVAMFFLRNAQMHSLNGQVTAYLTFGFTNPNLATLFLAMLYMLQLCRMQGKGKWLHGAFAAVLLYFVLRTRSRNALMAVAVFTAWVFFLRKRGNMRIRRAAAHLLAWLPGLFALAYVALIQEDWVQALFAFLGGEGKGLDARVEVWQRALSAVCASPLLGAYYAISDGTGMSQMHNSHLDIAASYGIPVLILVCVLLRRWLRQGRGMYIIGFACALLLGLGEAAVFSGGLGIYIFAGVFLLQAKGEKDEDRISE